LPLFRRCDGDLVPDVPPYRRIMPHIMRTKTESAVYFRQELDVTRTLEALRAWNEAHPELHATLFTVLLFALARALHERPRLNRFVVGRRHYQRKGVWLSFSAKKAKNDQAPIVVLKRELPADESFEAHLRALSADLTKGRSNERSHVDKELDLFLRIPTAMLGWGVRLLEWLDDWNLLPRSYIEPDPMYASAFVANLGSVGLEAAYHHLYEYGTIPVFATLGRVKTVDGKSTCVVKWSYDERVEDGLYCAAALERVRQIIEDAAL
jgi:hypothetical protein